MNPVLFILMRNDLDSLNCGKLIAQGSHASNAFVEQYHTFNQQLTVNLMNLTPSDDSYKLYVNTLEKINSSYTTWRNSTEQGFGTVLVLEGAMKDIEAAIETCISTGYIAAIVHDPSYPIRDGSIVHHLPLDTCSYVFVPDKDTDTVAVQALAEFSLHR